MALSGLDSLEGGNHVIQRDDLVEPLLELAAVTQGGAGLGQAAETAVGLMSRLYGHEAGITFRLKDGDLRTLACTNPTVEKCDVLQLQCGEGPFIVSEDGPNLADELASDSRWPIWGRAAAALGVTSLMTAPLPGGGGDVGFLTMYSASPCAFRAQDLAVVDVFARQAALSLGTVRMIGQLRSAVEGRTVIGQAQGVLMERFELSADQAFAVLRRHSRDNNMKLRDIAASLVETGELRVYRIRDGEG